MADHAPRVLKNQETLNQRITADRKRLLSEVRISGQTKTPVVEQMSGASFSDYEERQEILRQAEANLLVPVEDTK